MLLLARLRVVLVLTAGLLAANVDSRGQGTGQTPPPQQRPIFRAGTHFVQVDAYPRRDGKIVEGLTAKDFQVFEDGAPQSIETLEFVRAELNTPETDRRDPDSQEESLKLAADARNRVFVLYLDHYFGSLTGSYSLRRPITDMLNRMIAPNDLFSVTTVFTKPQDLIFGRKSTTLEDQLERHWTWGLKTTQPIDLEPEEQVIERCYGAAPAAYYAARTREWRTLETLDLLVRYLGMIRESRKVVIVFTRGWPLARPDLGYMRTISDGTNGTGTQVGVGPGGRLGTRPPPESRVADFAWCNTELMRASSLDNQRKFWDMLEDARRNNVTFYPVNPNGLTGGADDVLRTLASNTGGFTSLTNDLGGLLRRIADDVSAYYVLGYYTTNARFDGGFRQIQVKVSQRGVDVQARRGYLAPARDLPGPAASAPAKETADGLTEALGMLARLRPTAELFSRGLMTATEIAVVVELASPLLNDEAWSKGADVQVDIVDAAGGVAETRGRIEPGQRGVLLRAPKPAAPGPFRVTVRASGGAHELSDRLELAASPSSILGEPLLFRAAPSGQSPLRPVADLQFRRTERVHVEWPVSTALDRREARLVAKDGQPLAVPVTITEREQNGVAVLAADLSLAPLAAGDYVIEVSVTAAGKTERHFVALRVRQ